MPDEVADVAPVRAPPAARCRRPRSRRRGPPWPPSPSPPSSASSRRERRLLLGRVLDVGAGEAAAHPDDARDAVRELEGRVEHDRARPRAADEHRAVEARGVHHRDEVRAVRERDVLALGPAVAAACRSGRRDGGRRAPPTAGPTCGHPRCRRGPGRRPIPRPRPASTGARPRHPTNPSNASLMRRSPAPGRPPRRAAGGSGSSTSPARSRPG